MKPPTLRERVEAAQALAAAAMPGPWVLQGAQSDYEVLHPTGSMGSWQTGPRVLAVDLRAANSPCAADVDLMTAAPSLVDLITDLWDAYTTQEVEATAADLVRVTAERDAARAELARVTEAYAANVVNLDYYGAVAEREETAAVEARAEATRLRILLSAILQRFTEPGHIGASGDCLRTGWVQSGLVNEWWEAAGLPDVRTQEPLPPITAGYWRIAGCHSAHDGRVKVVCRVRGEEPAVWGLSFYADAPGERATWGYRTLGVRLSLALENWPRELWSPDTDALLEVSDG